MSLKLKKRFTGPKNCKLDANCPYRMICCGTDGKIGCGTHDNVGCGKNGMVGCDSQGMVGRASRGMVWLILAQMVWFNLSNTTFRHPFDTLVTGIGSHGMVGCGSHVMVEFANMLWKAYTGGFINCPPPEWLIVAHML